MDQILIRGLTTRCIIGDEPWERTTPQVLRINLALHYPVEHVGASDRLADTIDYAKVSAIVLAYAEGSQFHMIEALAEGIATVCLQHFPTTMVSVELFKPSHVAHVAEFGICLTRP